MEAWEGENGVSRLIDEGPQGVSDENGNLEPWDKFHGHQSDEDGTWSYSFYH